MWSCSTLSTRSRIRMPTFPSSGCRVMLQHPTLVFPNQTNRARCCASLFREKPKKEGGGIGGLSPGWFLSPSPLPPTPARYIGCYVDNTRRRALRGVSFFDYKKMTVFRCQDNCAER